MLLNPCRLRRLLCVWSKSRDEVGGLIIFSASRRLGSLVVVCVKATSKTH